MLENVIVTFNAWLCQCCFILAVADFPIALFASFCDDDSYYCFTCSADEFIGVCCAHLLS